MIEVKDVTFAYSKTPVIKGVTFDVKDGEIFGFLGPSGAGKSTLQKILIGMLSGYSGSVTVNGTEVKHHKGEFYEHIGVDFEFPSLYDKLTARQNLRFFASLYSTATRDADGLLESVGLLNDADKKVSDYSKGMKSRLGFIKALLHDPRLLFLDEPTGGLDPSNARLMKDMILKEREKGKTVILTTHNMEDAAELCDRVAFIVDGKIVAMDTPHRLIMRKSAAKIKYTYLEEGTERQGECGVGETAKDTLLASLIFQNRIQTIHSTEGTLGDVFLEVTGRRLS